MNEAFFVSTINDFHDVEELRCHFGMSEIGRYLNQKLIQ